MLSPRGCSTDHCPFDPFHPTIYCNAEENRLPFPWERRTEYFKGGVQTSGAIYFVIQIRHYFVWEDESINIIKETGNEHPGDKLPPF